MKKSLLFALMLMGFTSVVAQVLLIRELLVTFHGNELSIGIILANWLILEAIGSGFLGKLSEKVSRAWQAFAGLQLAISILIPLVIYGTRLAKSFIGLTFGQAVDLGPIFYTSFLLLAPLALFDGALFTFGCKIYSSKVEKGAPAAGKVYGLEAIGAVTGGVMVTFLFIPHFNSLQVAFILAALNLFSAFLLLILFGRIPAILTRLKTIPQKDKNFLKGSICFLAVVVILLTSSLYVLFTPRADELEAHSLKRQWSGYELRFSQNSIYGNVAVIEREKQFTFFADGIPIMTTPVPDIAFVEELVHLPMLFHPSPQKILLISGGAGGVLNEILKHPIERVDYVELDPLLIEAVQRFPTPLTESELGNPKVRILYIDGRKYVNTSTQRYDVVIVNLPPPSTLQLNRFYTKDFFSQAYKSLNEDGILTICSPGSLTYLSEELISLNACILQTLNDTFAYVRPIPGEVNLFLASPSAQILDIDLSTLIKRFHERELKTKLFTDFYLEYKLRQDRFHWFTESVTKAQDIRLNSDLSPSGLFYELSLLNAEFSPNLKGIFSLMGKANIPILLVPIGILAIGFWLVRKRTPRLKKAAIPIAVITTGFAGMAFNMILIFTFQSFYGYVYHTIGLLTAAFMVGLALGSIGMSHLMNKIKKDLSSLVKLEALVLSFSLLVPVILLFLHSYLTQPLAFAPVQSVIYLLSFTSGVLVGLEFPLANKIYLKGKERVGEVAGTLYASDLFGSWVGALVVSILLVPVLGIVETCALIACLKVASLILVVTSKL